MTVKRASRLFPLTAAFLALLAFAPSLRNDFVDWDDRVNFIQNPYYRGLGWEQLKWIWTNHLMARYVPVTWMTFGVDYVLWGMDPFGYHLTNILFHAANAVLFYFGALALLKLAIPNNARIPVGALFATLVFALHPLRVESVAWVTERRDLVCGLFYLLTIVAYLRKHYWSSLGACALAILSKEIAVTLPLILLVLDFYPLRQLSIRAVLEKIPFFTLSAAASVFAVYTGRQEGMAASPWVQGWLTRLAICVYNLAFYLWKSVIPVHLSPFYALTRHRVDPHDLPFQLSLGFVVLVTAAAILFRRRYPALLAVWLAYIAALLPVLGVLNTFKQIVADRYSYFGCMSWSVLAGGCFLSIFIFSEKFRFGRTLVVVMASVGLVCLTSLSWKQIGVWRNAESLWTHTAAVEPSFLSLNGMGLVLAERGDTAGSIGYFRQSIALDNEYELAHANLATALLSLGNWDEAGREFEAAFHIKPGLAVHNGWGYALLMQGRVDEAIGHFRLALDADPGDEAAQRNLNRALSMKGKS